MRLVCVIEVIENGFSELLVALKLQEDVDA